MRHNAFSKLSICLLVLVSGASFAGEMAVRCDGCSAEDRLSAVRSIPDAYDTAYVVDHVSGSVFRYAEETKDVESSDEGRNALFRNALAGLAVLRTLSIPEDIARTKTDLSNSNALGRCMQRFNAALKIHLEPVSRLIGAPVAGTWSALGLDQPFATTFEFEDGTSLDVTVTLGVEADTGRVSYADFDLEGYGHTPGRAD